MDKGSFRNEQLVAAILNYQFGRRIGDRILKDYAINVEVSKNTGRIRRIYVDKIYFGTVDATTGFIILSYKGAEIVKKYLPFPEYRVVIADEAVPFVERGKSVFNKFVLEVDENILPKDVVLVVDQNDNLIATGIAVLSALEMKQFSVGVAVKVKDARVLY